MTTNYQTVRATAQAKANTTGFDHGLEYCSMLQTYRTFMLPRRENRAGYELRCEVVSPECLAKCQPGHGPQR